MQTYLKSFECSDFRQINVGPSVGLYFWGTAHVDFNRDLLLSPNINLDWCDIKQANKYDCKNQYYCGNN